MATGFVSFESLLDQLSDAQFETPPAIVCNAHITGLAVARALTAHDVPVIAVDRTGTGVAHGSTAVDYAGQITYPLTDKDGFKADIEALTDILDHEPIAFPCMDEWVLAFAETEPDGVQLPFAPQEVIDTVLNKRSLYARATDLDVPVPETYDLTTTDPTDAADALGFPLVVKPAYKREFEETFGTNVIETTTRDDFIEVIDSARAHGIDVLAQERVPIKQGADCSLGSYLPHDPDREPHTFVGNPELRYPRSFGTSCVVRPTRNPTITESAVRILRDTGYHGISEAEFVYHADRDEYVLLDINTRPWKWIGLPVAAGINLPYAAYADAITDDYQAERSADPRWVYLPEYLSLLATDPSASDILSKTEWHAVISGSFERDDPPPITTGVYSPADPAPTIQVMTNEFTATEYYCAC